MASKQLPAVVLVGRPNVGKSTLFNRIAGTRRAIVTPTAGTTRDVIQQPADWRNVPFLLTDTAGMFGQSEDPLQKLVVEHGRRALENADVFVFVVDGREGLVPADLEIAAAIRATGRPIIVAINKADDKRARAGALDFYELGFEPVMEISAEHGQGIGDLLDEVIERLPDTAIGRGESGRARAAHCDCRAAERREVVARQSHPARGAHARQRCRRHDARFGRHEFSLASAAV